MSDVRKSFKQHSRSDWGQTLPEGTPLSFDQIKLGALLRIADAAELMASNFIALQEENKNLHSNNNYWMDVASKEQRRVTSLKGVITKLKRKLK